MKKLLVILLAAIAVAGCGVGSKDTSTNLRPAAVPTSPCSTTLSGCETQSGLVGLEEALRAYEQSQLEVFYAAVAAERQKQMAAVRGNGSGRCGDDWECFAACTRAHESDRGDASGNGKHDQGYGAVDPSGQYRGAYQFGASTWQGAVTRAGYPEYAGVPADQVPSAVQDAAARQLWLERGNQPWGGRC